MSNRRVYATTPNPRAALNELYMAERSSRAPSPPAVPSSLPATPRPTPAPTPRARARSEPGVAENLLNRKLISYVKKNAYLFFAQKKNFFKPIFISLDVGLLFNSNFMIWYQN